MKAKNSTLIRLLWTLLFLLVPILGVWTWVIADDYGWWFPQNVSSYGGEIDRLFYLILVPVTVTFLLTELVLVYCILRYSKNDESKSTFTHGNHKLEMIWTAIPAVVLLFIAFGQMGTWADIKINMPEDGPYTAAQPMAEVYASQFDWRIRYPDSSGNFEGMDVVESAFDLYVPVDTKVVIRLKSRDVLHSFFVPEFRVKQDAVPGMSIPVWFMAEKVGSYDLICAELCGWGHYKMAGKIHVLPQDEYEQWLAESREALYSNGTEETP